MNLADYPDADVSLKAFQFFSVAFSIIGVQFDPEDLKKEVLEHPRPHTYTGLSEILLLYGVDHLAVNTSIDHLYDITEPAIVKFTDPTPGFIIITEMTPSSIHFCDEHFTFHQLPPADFISRCSSYFICVEYNQERCSDPNAGGSNFWFNKPGISIPTLVMISLSFFVLLFAIKLNDDAQFALSLSFFLLQSMLYIAVYSSRAPWAERFNMILKNRKGKQVPLKYSLLYNDLPVVISLTSVLELACSKLVRNGQSMLTILFIQASLYIIGLGIFLLLNFRKVRPDIFWYAIMVTLGMVDLVFFYMLVTTFDYDSWTMLLSINLILLVFSLWRLGNVGLQTNELLTNNLKYNFVRRSKGMLGLLTQHSRSRSYSVLDDEIALGNAEAPITLIFVMDPYQSSSRAEFRELYKRVSTDLLPQVRTIVRFSVQRVTVRQFAEFILFYKRAHGSSNALNLIQRWCAGSDFDFNRFRSAELVPEIILSEKTDDLLAHWKVWLTELNLNYTPLYFINGKVIPRGFTVADFTNSLR